MMSAEPSSNRSHSYKDRQKEIINKVAGEAERLPLLDSGLWFHDDVRNNFYYACYLFAAAVDDSFRLDSDREAARKKAEAVLLETVLLQNREPGTPLYGHWPLSLHPVPREAAPHELPVEIMGSLMAWFCRQYSSLFSAGLRIAFHTAIGHIYRSGFFRKDIENYGHHEAKYTAAKLIFGRLFGDEELREDGRASLEQMLAYIRAKGMPEYGSLPWFWHWVQAFTCAWELEEDSGVKAVLGEMLDHLWSERAAFYFRGAWAGAHSRGWPHDVPGDRNVLHDYVQFGEFSLPGRMPRTEYAGFLFYEAPAQIRELALDRRTPAEVKKLTQKVVSGDPAPQPLLHSYAYITGEYAAGGLWERVEEFDNEQLRWAYSLPVSGEAGANQLYFFHPGKGYQEGDPRHQSAYMEVLYHKGTVISLFPVPKGKDNTVIGVLPKGQWLEQPQALFGLVDNVYFAVYLSNTYELVERKDYLEVQASGMPGGVVVEAMEVKQAVQRGIVSLAEFALEMSAKAPVFEAVTVLAAEYNTSGGDQLRLEVSEGEGSAALHNGKRISMEDYAV
ncbi:hypothetical protein PAECIP111892_01152 [Paenibacillus auburnensis]|uniref:Uncharacterized protein n=2 Tax=Paenibacillus auburnensis TaxID=2905649 RepID=A0ABM9BT08_9BACL|nr:hypothetical protein PAECIP111892_01152 [Paenibacillus auburnensis]